MAPDTPDTADGTSDDDNASKAERTVDWLASLSDEELAEERRKAHQPISKETHPGTGYRSAAFARWRQGIRQQAVAASRLHVRSGSPTKPSSRGLLSSRPVARHAEDTLPASVISAAS